MKRQGQVRTFGAAQHAVCTNFVEVLSRFNLSRRAVQCHRSMSFISAQGFFFVSICRCLRLMLFAKSESVRNAEVPPRLVGRSASFSLHYQP